MTRKRETRLFTSASSFNLTKPSQKFRVKLITFHYIHIKIIFAADRGQSAVWKLFIENNLAQMNPGRCFHCCGAMKSKREAGGENEKEKSGFRYMHGVGRGGGNPLVDLA